MKGKIIGVIVLVACLAAIITIVKKFFKTKDSNNTSTNFADIETYDKDNQVNAEKMTVDRMNQRNQQAHDILKDSFSEMKASKESIEQNKKEIENLFEDLKK